MRNNTMEFNDSTRYVLNNMTDERCIECVSILLHSTGDEYYSECWFCNKNYYAGDEVSEITTIDKPVSDAEFELLVKTAMDRGLENSFDRNPFTHDDYWDCECADYYIHAKADRVVCPICGRAEEDGFPDSRISEVLMGGRFFRTT